MVLVFRRSDRKHYMIFLRTPGQSTYSSNPVTVIDLSFVDPRSVDLCLGDLGSLYGGRVYRRKRGSDGEEFEQVGLHVGQ